MALERAFAGARADAVVHLAANAQVKAPWEELVNTRGTTFRKLPPEQQQGLDSSRAAKLMVAAPSVIRRPVIESGKTLLIGFDPERYQAVLARR